MANEARVWAEPVDAAVKRDTTIPAARVWSLTVDVAISRVIRTIPPLRQRQRDDVTRVAGTARNQPSSKQQSIRQGWANTYL